MSSGFGEVSSPLRIIGPNAQGNADFSSGAILGFSTLFTEQAPEDWPVAIVSQSDRCARRPTASCDVGVGTRIGLQQVDSISALVDSTNLYQRYWRDRPPDSPSPATPVHPACSPRTPRVNWLSCRRS
ncbi:hypothetical protein [Prauserella flavalba]|uniref:hypothetical protein n=1 Tax=Prauserella flavalba TaxID=1477506 RepID=UPI0036EDED21